MVGLDSDSAAYDGARAQLAGRAGGDQSSAAIHALRMVHWAATSVGAASVGAASVGGASGAAGGTASGTASGAAGGGGTPTGVPSPADLLSALALLRYLREELAVWEPLLIAAARDHGVSWAQLAPALGVASRQAAERRYLRLRPAAAGEPATTGDARIQAERDRRAGDRAVKDWARRNSAWLRQLAGQVGALEGLDEPARHQAGLVRQALALDDVARLLPTLAGARSYLQPTHPVLAAQIGTVAEQAELLRRDVHQARVQSGSRAWVEPR